VIDEVLGMLVTLFMNPVGWMGAILGFLLFRLSDIVKPYPANKLEELHGGVGVMADDFMAAIYANLALRAIVAFSNLVVGELINLVIDRAITRSQLPNYSITRFPDSTIMKAWIVAIGSELLTPFRVDTNSLAITERLNAIGCDVRLKIVVGDDIDELATTFERGIGRVDLIVCTGGLGPTEDDITRDALTRVLQVPVDIDQSIVDRIRQRFERRGMTMPENNKRQGMVPRGATVVENPRGTAPGLWIERDGTSIVLL